MLDVVIDLEAFCKANGMMESASAFCVAREAISGELVAETRCVPHLDGTHSPVLKSF